MRFLLAFGLLLLDASEHLSNSSSLVALESEDIGDGFVTHAGKLMEQYGEKCFVARCADLCHVVSVNDWLGTEVADCLDEFFTICTENAIQLFAISGRHLDGLGVDDAIRRIIDSCCAQSEQGFADTNTSISADAVPHLQLFDIWHCFLFLFVNDDCFPPLMVAKGNTSLTKKPPQRNDIVKARRRSNCAESVDAVAPLPYRAVKGFANIVLSPTPMVFAGFATMCWQQAGGTR